MEGTFLLLLLLHMLIYLCLGMFLGVYLETHPRHYRLFEDGRDSIVLATLMAWPILATVVFLERYEHFSPAIRR